MMILDYLSFGFTRSCTTIRIKKTGCSVIEPRWEDSEEYPMTPSEIIRYLYGYFKSDRCRLIFLVRTTIKVIFTTDDFQLDKPISIGEYIPRGTKVCFFVISDDNPNHQECTFSFEKFPFTCKFFDLDSRGLGKNLLLSTIPKTHHLEVVDFGKIETVLGFAHFYRLFPRLKILKFAINIDIFSHEETKSYVFRNCKTLKLKTNNVNNLDWIPRVLPNLRNLHMSCDIDRENLDESAPLLSFLPLKRCRNLRNVDIAFLSLTVTPQHLIDLLHQNKTIKRLRIHVSFSPFTLYPDTNEISNDCVEVLELFTFRTTYSKKREIITMDLVNFFLNSLPKLKHFGMVNQLMKEDSRDISMDTEGFLNSMKYINFFQKGGVIGGNNDDDNNNNNSVITQEVVDFFSDPKQEFKFDSFSFFFPKVILKHEFFGKNKWKNLKRLEFGCKNDIELINVIYKEELPIEHLQSGTAIYPGHLGILSRMKKLRSFSGVGVDRHMKSFIKLSMKNLRSFCFNERTEGVFYRCCDEYPKMIDPLERYDFYGIDQLEEEEEKEEEEEEEDVIKVFIGEYAEGFGEDDGMKKEDHENISKDYYNGFDSIFLLKKEDNSKLMNNISISKEVFETFKKSIVLKIVPQSYGYTIISKIPSLVNSKKCFKFVYQYHLRMRHTFNETFESFTMDRPQRKQKWKKAGVGYQSIIDLRDNDESGFSQVNRTFDIFSRSMHNDFYCYEYEFAEEHLLRTIEKAIFGKQVIADLKYLLKFFYFIGGCDLKFPYGSFGEFSKRKKWIFGVCEDVYKVHFKENEQYDYFGDEDEKINIAFLGQDFDVDPVEQKKEKDEDIKRRDGGGGGGGCILQ